MKNIVYIEKVDNTYFKLTSNDENSIRRIGKKFSFFAENYKHMPKYQQHVWDGKISLLNGFSKLFPIGLWKHLFDFCEEMRYIFTPLNFDINDLIDVNLNKSDINAMCKIICEKNGKELRDYQVDAIFNALKYKRATIESATGSGKSFMIYTVLKHMLITNNASKILLIVPTVDLVKQMHCDLCSYKWKNNVNEIFTLYSNTPQKMKKEYNNFKGKVLISTWQSLNTRKDFFFKQFDGVVCDEAHLAKSKSINTIMSKINAPYKLSFTGSMPDNNIEQALAYHTIVGFSGPVVFQYLSKKLINEGHLADLSITNVLLKYPYEFKQKNQKRQYDEEIDAIEMFEDRDKIFPYIIKHHVENNITSNSNFLILCKHVNNGHIERISNHVQKTLPNFNVFTVHGKIKSKERDKAKQHMKTNNGNCVIVATYATFSTGIDIPNLGNVIFGSPYKSKFKIIQGIGRGLRVHKTKENCCLYDIVDDLSDTQGTGRIVNKNHAYKHFEARKLLYDKQQFEYNDIIFNLTSD